MVKSESYLIDKHISLRIFHGTFFTNCYLHCTIKKKGLKAYTCSLNMAEPENTITKIMKVREDFLKQITLDLDKIKNK